MKFAFKNKAVDILSKAGYIKRTNGSYIRKERGGRFHVYLYGNKKIDMHYDLYVAGGRRHFTAPVPTKLKEENQTLQVIDQTYEKEKTDPKTEKSTQA